MTKALPLEFLVSVARVTRNLKLLPLWAYHPHVVAWYETKTTVKA